MSAHEIQLAEAYSEQSAELTRLRAREAVLVEASPDDLRNQGWAVVCHNDYRWNGESHTFWSFTKGREFIKGEGRTDAEALNEIRKALATLDVPDPKEQR